MVIRSFILAAIVAMSSSLPSCLVDTEDEFKADFHVHLDAQRLHVDGFRVTLDLLQPNQPLEPIGDKFNREFVVSACFKAAFPNPSLWGKEECIADLNRQIREWFDSEVRPWQVACTDPSSLALPTDFGETGTFFTSNTWWSGDGAQQDYLDVCAKAARDTAAFATFKRDPSYVHVLEHTSRDLGLGYLANLYARDPELLAGPRLDRMRLNDVYGAELMDFDGEREVRAARGVEDDDAEGGLGPISPSTLRYIHALSLLRKHFPAKMLGSSGSGGTTTGKKEGSGGESHICEVGGGYGGLAHVTLSGAPEAVKKYTTFDLPEPAALANRYLRALGWGEGTARATTLAALHDEGKLLIDGSGRGEGGAVAPPPSGSGRGGNNSSGEQVPCSLVVSHYAFTELDATTQEEYVRALVSSAEATAGLLFVGLSNSLTVSVLLEELGFDLEVHVEDPPSGLVQVPNAVFVFHRRELLL